MKQFLCSLAIILAGFSQVHADINFNFTYIDVSSESNFGFDDPTEGAARRAVVDSVADYINTVVDHDGTIDIRWNASTNAPTGNTLASMGAFYFGGSGVTNGFVFDHATTGNDPFGGEVDGEGQVNFGRSWNSGLGNPSGSQFDLFSVVLHEITHAMGFATVFNQDGSTAIPGTRTVYDSLLEDVNGTRLLNGTNFVGNSSVFTSGNLFIDVGSGVLEANAPANFAGGSSISHFDFGVPGSNVMFPGIAPGVSNREYTENDLAVLSAIGWNVSVVPEPGSGLVICAIGLVAICKRRR